MYPIRLLRCSDRNQIWPFWLAASRFFILLVPIRDPFMGHSFRFHVVGGSLPAPSIIRHRLIWGHFLRVILTYTFPYCGLSPPSTTSDLRPFPHTPLHLYYID